MYIYIYISAVCRQRRPVLRQQVLHLYIPQRGVQWKQGEVIDMLQ